MKKFLFVIFICVTCCVNAQSVKHIVVIGVDGMSPDGILKANTPNMDRLVEEGTWTFGAQAVLPTSSSPNWASMIMGADPDLHEIRANSWKRKDLKGKTYCDGKEGESWPTVFRVLREQRPKAKIGIFHHWLDYGRLVEPGVTNVKQWAVSKELCINRGISYFKMAKPGLLFLHLDHVDHAGHAFGHGTGPYYKSVEAADQLIGKMIDAINKSGRAEETVILVTADHGGKGKGHGGDTPEERTIPWIIAGPGIAKGKEIKDVVNTYDTAATIANLLGLTLPECWIGKPVEVSERN